MRKYLFLLLILFVNSLYAAELYVGSGVCDITPDQPIMLSGQFHPRVSTSVQYPIQANILVLESRDGDKQLDSAIIISLDLVTLHPAFQKALIPALIAVKPESDSYDLGKLVLCATHTHTSAVLSDSQFPPQDKGEMKPSKYIEWVCPKIAAAVKQAWQSRRRGNFSYGLDHAVVAYNRRAVYENGTAVMYGPTNTPNFRAQEGMEDHDVNSLFFWDEDDNLMAMAINISCPSQEVEGISQISSDYWGPTRQLLRKKYGSDIAVLGLCGAAGDQSPHLRYMQGATTRMDSLRKLSRLQEIARRIVAAVDDTYDVVKNDRYDQPVLKHQTEVLTLPMRIPTEAEYKQSIQNYEAKKGNPNDGQVRWYKRIITRYEDLAQNPNPTYDTTINVIRLGDTVLCFNQFELYTDFAIQMKARSKAVQTFIVQISAGAGRPITAEQSPDGIASPWTFSESAGTYLPSQRAVLGGGYGAIIQSNTVGPEGGQVLVEETLKIANGMFE